MIRKLKSGEYRITPGRKTRRQINGKRSSLWATWELFPHWPLLKNTSRKYNTLKKVNPLIRININP